MAKEAGNSRKPKKRSDDFGGFSFISVHLSQIDKDWLSAADCLTEFPLTQVLDLAATGYKFSIREDEKNNTFIASLADLREGSPSFKRILSGRGSTALNAWFSLAYRHFHLLQGDWSAETGEAAGADFD